MPKKFDACVRSGGKIRTINLNETQYAHICIKKDGIIKNGGQSIMGEVKVRKTPKK